MNVSGVMTSPAFAVTPYRATVHHTGPMDENGAGRLPVVDPRGDPVGVVGRRDLLRFSNRPDAEIAHEMG